MSISPSPTRGADRAAAMSRSIMDDFPFIPVDDPPGPANARAICAPAYHTDPPKPGKCAFVPILETVRRKREHRTAGAGHQDTNSTRPPAHGGQNLACR